MQLLLFVLAIILFIALVLVHEWGHYIIARRNGVEVEEFGLGLPPRAVSKKLKSGMLLSLNWLPLGGFVKLKGEHDSDSEPGSFGAARLRVKTKILLAGVTMNLLAGLVLLMILCWIGMPVLLSKDFNGQDQFTVKSDTHITHQEVEAGNVLPGSPADKAGLVSTDRITSVTGQGSPAVRQINTQDQLHRATSDFAGQGVQIGLLHGNQGEVKNVKLLSRAEVAASHGAKGYLGVEPNQLTIQRSTWSAPIVAVGFTTQLVWLSLQGLGHAVGGVGSIIAGIFSGNHAARVAGQSEASSQVGGPVAIMQILWNSGGLGFNFMLIFIAIISLTLALMNVLPIPALDGGRLFMTLISRGIFKRPLSRAAEERIVAGGMIFILALIVLITIVDINRSF